MNGDALYDGAEAAVLPFGVKKVKLAKLKEESSELVRLELLILPLPCESRITLLQGLIAFGKALIVFDVFVLVKSRYRIGSDTFFNQPCNHLHLLGNRTKLGIDFGVIGEGLFYKSAVLNQGCSVLNEETQGKAGIILESIFC